MKTRVLTIKQRIYQSELLPAVETSDPRLREVIAWADSNPAVWRIVSGGRSKAFGPNSSVYIGWAQRSMAPEAMLERARHFRSLVVETERHAVGPSIFTWRAKFTFAHVGDRGFTGGFFQQHDEHYARNCLVLDYTPELFSEVLAKFKAWMDPYYQTQGITVDGRVVWVVEKGA